LIPDLETTTYSATAIEYAGKKAALRIIPAVAEYWATQKISDNSGNRVSGTWVDRVEKLWQLYDRLVREVSELAVDVGVENPTNVTKKRRPIGVTTGANPDYLTPDVETFPRQAAVPTGA
jgi:hypothetical protein